MSNMHGVQKPGATGASFLSWPVTTPGRWSVGLALVFLLGMGINVLLSVVARLQPPPWLQPLLGIGGLVLAACAIASGVTALVALRRHERSWFVWIPIAVGAWMLFIVLGEFLIPQ